MRLLQSLQESTYCFEPSRINQQKTYFDIVVYGYYEWKGKNTNGTFEDYKAEMSKPGNEKLAKAIDAIQNVVNQNLYFQHYFVDTFFSNDGNEERSKSISLAKRKWQMVYTMNHLSDYGVENKIGKISDQEAEALVMDLINTKEKLWKSIKQLKGVNR